MTPFPLFLRHDQPNSFLNEQLENHQLSIITRRDAREMNHFLWDGKKLVWVDHEAGHLEIDFLAPKRQWRFQNMSRANEPLLRALDWHGEKPQTVFDLTAGLGSDATLLLFAGFQITLFERDPILQCLLDYALLQFKTELPDQATMIHLIKEDSITYLNGLNQVDIPDLIYMDPMYPTREKSALVKKELRIIRNLVGDDQDSTQLLEAALALGVKRIVVKRPGRAEYVGKRTPHHSIEAPNTRFDVYM